MAPPRTVVPLASVGGSTRPLTKIKPPAPDARPLSAASTSFTDEIEAFVLPPELRWLSQAASLPGAVPVDDDDDDEAAAAGGEGAIPRAYDPERGSGAADGLPTIPDASPRGHNGHAGGDSPRERGVALPWHHTLAPVGVDMFPPPAADSTPSTPCTEPDAIDSIEMCEMEGEEEQSVGERLSVEDADAAHVASSAAAHRDQYGGLGRSMHYGDGGVATTRAPRGRGMVLGRDSGVGILPATRVSAGVRLEPPTSMHAPMGNGARLRAKGTLKGVRPWQRNKGGGRAAD